MNIDEMISDNDVEDGPLIVHFNPGELTDLATVSLTAALMHYEITKLRQTRYKSSNLYTVDLDEIPLPPSIKSRISELVECNMVHARSKWWAHHHECVFLQNLPADIMIDWLDQLVWLPGGAINYRQTAEKLLNCGKLTNVQKMQLACSYCFVEYVEVLKETLTNAEINNACGEYHVSKDLISRYWHNRLQLGPLFILYVNSHVMLLNRLIFSLKYYEEWSAVVYFFNKSNNEDRLLMVSDFIDYGKPKITWHLLLALTGPELDSVIRGKSRQIMTTMVKEDRYFEYTVLIWKRMVHLIDDDTVANILLCVNDSNYERDYLNSLLWEMWLGTLERQKKFMVEERLYDFIAKFDTHEYNFFNHPNYPLIIDMLSRSGPERRYKYLTRHYPYLILGQLHQRNFIDQIMKLCIGSDEQIMIFKNTIMINYNYISIDCQYLICYGCINAVSDYVDFCTSNQLVNRGLKKMILTKIPVQILFEFLFYNYTSVDRMAKFDRYLNEIFTEHESKEFLNGIVTHSDNLKGMLRVLKFHFRRVIECVEKFVSSKKILLGVKNYFFQNYRLEEDYSHEVFFNLTVWYLNWDKSVMKNYKKSSCRVCEVSDAEMTSEKTSVFEAFMEFISCDSDDSEDEYY